jgi:hypothetical protein
LLPYAEAAYLNEEETPTADFHVSAAGGLNSGQFNPKRNSEKENIEYRIMNIECRSKVFCLFYKK